MLSRRYAPIDYNGGLQNWWAQEDDRGVMYFANLNGVLEYDGEHWRCFKVGHNAAVRSLAKDAQGRIYVGAYAELGYLKVDGSGSLGYESLMGLVDGEHADFKDIWCVHCLGDTVLFLTDRCIMRLVDGRIDYFDSPTEGFYLAFELAGVYYVQERGRGLLRLRGDSLEMVSDLPLFRKYQLHGIFARADGSLLVATRAHGLFVYSPQSDSACPIDAISAQARRINSYFKEHVYYYGIALPNNRLALSALTGNVLIVDEDWNIADVIDRTIRQNDSEVLFLYLTSNNLLWLGLGNGLCQVEALSELRYWDGTMGIYGRISDVAYHDDHLYISTKQGLFRARSRPEPFGFTRFDRVEGQLELAHTFLNFSPPGGPPMLLLSSSAGIYRVDGLAAHRVMNLPYVAQLYATPAEPHSVLAAASYGLHLLRYSGGRWAHLGPQFGITDVVRGVAHDSLNNIWVATQIDGAYRVAGFGTARGCTVDRFDATHGYPQFERVYIADGPRVVVARGEHYAFDPIRQCFLRTPASRAIGPADPLASKSFARFVKSGRSFMFYPDQHPELGRWYSSDDGLVHFDPGAYVPRTGAVPPAIIREVHTEDSLLFGGTNFERCGADVLPSAKSKVDLGIVLPHNHSTLTLNYACPYFAREQHVEYSTRLRGYDATWSEWSSENKRNYTNLPPGRYAFEVRARHLGQFEAQPAEFVFEVRRNWIIVNLGIAAIAMFMGFVLLNLVHNVRLKREVTEMATAIVLHSKQIDSKEEEIQAQHEVLSERERELVHSRNLLVVQREYLIKVKKELEESNIDKMRMLRAIAHDLRNPVGTWVMLSDHLLSEHEQGHLSSDELGAHLISISRHAHNTYDLLERQLDWSAVQACDLRFAPQPIALHDLCQALVRHLRFRLTDKKLELSLDVPPSTRVWADEYMLNAVLRNLLTNAIKFSHRGGTIELRVWQGASGSHHVAVSDHGVGIPTDALPHLFDGAVQTHGTGNERGRGIGLGLVREMVERMGGRIYVSSELGMGSIFVFSLPQLPGDMLRE
ncbi:MAG: HAMP domain-containing histidine kinase [Bacteroidales bacterium]|nr:HAMP domain-containing histidine kinase [Bacteroidales bacterium]